MKKSFSEKYNGQKVSDIFKEYADPILQLYLQGRGQFRVEEVEQILKMPWLIWNSLVIQNDPKNKIDYCTSIDLLIRNKPDAKYLIEALRERKKTLFNQYNFLFGDIKITFNESTNEMMLWVEAKVIP